MAAGKGGLFFEKIWRFVRTIYFMVVMMSSLLVLSLPILVAIGDILVPCVLISNFTCVRCYSFKEHLNRYSFRSSLTDIPVVSVVRSLIITCMYASLFPCAHLRFLSILFFFSVWLPGFLWAFRFICTCFDYWSNSQPSTSQFK